MCSKTAVAPLDRMKILLQAHQSHYKHHGVFSGLLTIIKKESFMALYKGNGAQMVRIFPYAATQFTAFEIYKKVIQFVITLCASRKFLQGLLKRPQNYSLTPPLLPVLREALRTKSPHPTFRQILRGCRRWSHGSDAHISTRHHSSSIGIPSDWRAQIHRNPSHSRFNAEGRRRGESSLPRLRPNSYGHGSLRRVVLLLLRSAQVCLHEVFAEFNL